MVTVTLDLEAILFDIDGTLVDSTPIVERTWRAWSARYGVDPEAVLAACHGVRSQDTVAQFLPPEQCAAAVAALETLEGDDFDGVEALPATVELLSALPADRWAAVTSGPRDLMLQRLSVAGLPVPTVLVAADDVINGKPDPEGYLKAASSLGFDITRCLVVEDAPAGLAAGRASGAKTLGVTTSHAAAALTDADWVVDDLTALALDVSGGELRIEIRS